MSASPRQQAQGSVSPIDLRVRVVALLLEPALSVARASALPLDDLQRLVAVGYFREARARGMSFRAIARRFGKSLRTITNLSKQSSEEGIHLGETELLSYQRQLVVRASQAGQGGVALPALLAGFPQAKPEVLEEQLEALVKGGVLECEGEQVRVVAAHLDLTQDVLSARLESLRHFLHAISLTAHRRFLARGRGGEAFARVLSFRAEQDALQQLRDDVYGKLRERVFEADEEASDDALGAMVTFCLIEDDDDPAFRPPG